MNAADETTWSEAKVRRIARVMVWLLTAAWASLCAGLYLANYARPGVAVDKLLAEAGSAIVLILGGFVVAYSLTAAIGD